MEENEFIEEQEMQEELNVDLPETNQELRSTEGHDNANSKNRGRGRAMKKSAHLQTLEGRNPIILNAWGQPIGPEESIKDFTFFVGTLSRMPNLCPLNVEKWTDMDKVYKGAKERIWKYVKKNANEEKKEPSLAEVFRATRKRVLGRAYKEPIEDTQTKIARMEEIASQQAGEHVEGGESSNRVDPFESVMGKDPKRRLRLYERGVTASTLGKVSARSSGASVYVPEELLISIKEDVAAQLRFELRNELKTQVTQEVKDHWATEYCQTMAHQLKQLHPQLDFNAEALRRIATAT
ncbi:hypothetical protein Dimus_025098 [Dionaea muscipula]